LAEVTARKCWILCRLAVIASGMATFDDAFTAVIGIEGGVTIDSGGLTKYGISQRAFPTLDIRGLTLDAAKFIYRTNYWNAIAGDHLYPQVAVILFDCAVNQGVGAAARILQAAVNTTQDGVIGPGTIAALSRWDNRRIELANEISARRAVRYAGTANFDTYGLGWMRRLMTMTATALRAA
jgi:lysozyme family protein